MFYRNRLTRSQDNRGTDGWTEHRQSGHNRFFSCENIPKMQKATSKTVKGEAPNDK